MCLIIYVIFLTQSEEFVSHFLCCLDKTHLLVRSNRLENTVLVSLECCQEQGLKNALGMQMDAAKGIDGYLQSVNVVAPSVGVLVLSFLLKYNQLFHRKVQ